MKTEWLIDIIKIISWLYQPSSFCDDLLFGTAAVSAADRYLADRSFFQTPAVGSYRTPGVLSKNQQNNLFKFIRHYPYDRFITAQKNDGLSLNIVFSHRI